MARPARYKTPQQLEKKVNEYFEENKDSPTLAGLALYLGFGSWQSINDYGDKSLKYGGHSKEFSYIISRARLRIIDFLEKLANRDKGSPQGIIHRLKVMKYNAPDEIKHSGQINLMGALNEALNDDNKDNAAK